jgi:DegV family protein with EDD domain
MARIRVVTDSASDVPDDVAARLDIDVVSLTIRFGDEEFVDRVELTPEAFWAKCKTSKTLPETSAPSVGAFQAAYERAKADGCDGVLVLTLSSLLSATYQSANLAADTMKGLIEVRVIDTLNVSMGQGLVAIDCAELAATGATLADVAERANALLPKSGVVGTIDTLEHLIKGGRIGGAKALIGQVLSIKPLVELKGGVVAEAGRQRTRAKALAAVAAATATHAPLRRLALVHGACSEADVVALLALATEIKSEFPIIVGDIGPVVGTHAGPGIIALTFVES